jgi:hypothetical protein
VFDSLINTVVGFETDIFIHSTCIANVDIDGVGVVVILYDPKDIYVSHRVE